VLLRLVSIGFTGPVKVLSFVVLVIVATALMVAGGQAIALVRPAPSAGEIGLGVVPLTVFVFVPVYLGSIASYYDVRRSAKSRRYYRVYFWVAIALESLAAVATVVFAVVAGAPVWLPVIFIATAAVLLAIALTVGPKLVRRGESNAPTPTAWTPIERREISRKAWIVAVTFVVLLVVGLVLTALLLPHDVATGVQFALQFAAIIASIVCIVFSLPYARRVREETGRDLDRTTKIAKVVLRAKPLELDDDEQLVAAKYSAVVPTFLAFQLGYIGLLYLGLGSQQIRLLADGVDLGLSIPILIIFVVVIVVLFPLMIVRIRRARRYAREHAHLLPAAG